VKVALVHYHLQPGGVTRVIENTVEAWKINGNGPEDYVILSGRNYPERKLQNVRVVEGLDYMDLSDATDPLILKERMEEAARSVLGQLPDIWHIHNHSLGKNAGLSGAVSELAKSGARLLLQPHDFAEDGRPQNFRNLGDTRALLYPTARQIHYAALNKRDQLFLQKTTQDYNSPIHLLANAIPHQPDLGNLVNKKHFPELPENLILYPVRAVRRKNLGELALLSATHPEFHFANSLGPTNPAFHSTYMDWIEYSQYHKLNLTYGLGERTEARFPEMVNHAQAIINVSVAEGFGLGFLEPWTFEKCLIGRNIPEITSDFSELGVNLENLYHELWVDQSLIDHQELHNSISTCLNSAYHDYRRELPVDAVRHATASIHTEYGVKFGRLNEDLQKQVIAGIQSSDEETLSIQSQAKLKILDKPSIRHNQAAVTENFSLSAYGSRVIQIYRNLLESQTEKVTFANSEKMLDQFLSPERLNLLRS
jgi:hypothetical protein